MQEKLGDGTNPIKRKLNVFFILDKSGSMFGERIAALNDAISVTANALKEVEANNPYLRIVIKIIEFSSKAELTNGAEGQDLDNFNWRDITAEGYTVTASAINLLCDQLSIELMPRRGYPPVCVLVSDGYCTEKDESYNAAIARLNHNPWGRKAARIVISIGNDLDEKALRMFVNERGAYINCQSATDIINYIRLTSTEATLSQSKSKEQDYFNQEKSYDNTGSKESINLNEVF